MASTVAPIPSTSTPATTASTWTIDPAHSAAEFKVRHMMISYVKGEFSGLSGVLNLYETDYTKSSVRASIPTASVRTGDDKRDSHLKNADFFDIERFPALTFQSTNIATAGDNNYIVTGDLTIRDITRSVILTVEDLSKPSKDPWGHQRIGVTGSTKVKRKDFGLTWNMALDSGGMLLGEEVTITLDVQFVSA